MDLDVGTPLCKFQTLVVLINSDTETLLGFLLADHVFVQKVFNILRLRQVSANSCRIGPFVVMNDLVTDIDAFIANVNAGASDQFSNVVLRLAAKRTAEKFFRPSKVRHKLCCLPTQGLCQLGPDFHVNPTKRQGQTFRLFVPMFDDLVDQAILFCLDRR